MTGAEIATLMAAILSLVGSCIAAAAAFSAAQTARESAREVAKLNAAFGKELKDHEFRLAHLQRVIAKRFEVCELFITLAAKATHSGKTFETDISNDWELFRQFADDWLNAHVLSFWLEDARQLEYAHIMQKVVSVLIAVSKFPEEDRAAEFPRLYKERTPNIDVMAIDFIDGIRADYLVLDQLEPKSPEPTGE